MRRLEKAAPSTSGISTTTKRNREESCPEQVNRCEKIERDDEQPEKSLTIDFRAQLFSQMWTGTTRSQHSPHEASASIGMEMESHRESAPLTLCLNSTFSPHRRLCKMCQ